MNKFTASVAILVSIGTYSVHAQNKVGLPDSTLFREVDRLQSVGSRWDSLSLNELNKIDSSINHLTKKIDSLQSHGLPTSHYQNKIDSLSRRLNFNVSIKSPIDSLRRRGKTFFSKANHKRDSLQNEIHKKSIALQKKIKGATGSVDSLALKAANKINSKLGRITAEENKVLKEAKLPNSSLPVPNASAIGKELNPSGELNQLNNQIPNANLPDANALGKELNSPGDLNQLNSVNKELSNATQGNPVTSEIKKLETAPSKELAGSGVVKSIAELKTEEQKIKGVEKKADGYKQDIKKVGKGEIQQMQALPKDAENAASNVAEMKELKSETAQIKTTKNALQQYNDLLQNMGTPKGLKEGGAIATKEMPDLFAGNEAKLQAGIAQLDKLKKKYHTIADSRYLPKHVPNEMKGKPLKDRLIPGLTLQLYKVDKLGIDLSPYLMYRLTGKLRLGASGTYRLLINSKQWNIRPGMVYGVRAMADYRWINSWYGHMEGEWMHYDPTVQSQYRFPADPPLKEWNTKLNIGMLRTYKISRRFMGQCQLLYNALDWTHFPQNRNTSVRFGFEYKFNAKKPGKK